MTASPELEFIGASRHALLEDLLSTFEAVKEQRQPRLVLLEAESGWGKSRLIHEFYRRIAGTQPAPRYWPASILDGVPEADRASLKTAEGRRKRIYPETFEVPEGAVPQWLWWGISATARQGGSLRTLDHDLVQLRRHAPNLERRWRQLASLKQKAGDLLSKDRLRDVARGSAADLVGGAVLPAVPFAGSVLTVAGRALADQLAELRRSGAMLIGDAREEGKGLTEEVARDLGRFADVGIPVVIAVEDVHEADESLLDFLVRIVENGTGPILVLATAWPQSGGPTARLRAGVSRTRRSVRSLDREDPHLSEDDRVALVASLLPATNLAQRRAFARHYENIYAVEIACSSSQVRDLLVDGDLTEEAIGGLPVDLGGLWAKEWERLTEETRWAIVLSVLSSPGGIGDLFSDEMQWDVALAPAASQTIEWAKHLTDVLREDIDDQSAQRAWIRQIDDWVRTCHEPAKFRLIRRFGHETLVTQKRREAFWRALADTISLAEARLSENRRLSRAMVLTQLGVAGFAEWNEKSIEAGITVMGRAVEANHTSTLRLAVQIGRQLPDLDARGAVRRRELLVGAFFKLGLLQDALEESTVLAGDCAALLGPNDRRTLVERKKLAGLLGHLRRHDESVSAYQALLETCASELGPHDDLTLGVRSSLAYWLSFVGRRVEGLKERQRLVEDYASVFGAEDRRTLWARLDFGAALRGAGRRTAAREEFRRLAEDASRFLGDMHPTTLAAQRHFAIELGRAGRHDEAIEELRTLVQGIASIWGPESGATLEARMVLSGQLAQARRYEEALEEDRWRAEVLTRLRGPDHAGTFAARIHVARGLARLGQWQEALDEQRAIVADMERAFGRQNPQFFRAREDLADLLAGSGQNNDAVEERGRLVADMEEQLGPEHLDTLRAKCELALERYRAGNASGLTELAAVLDEASAVLPDGDDHLAYFRNVLARARSL